MANCTLPCSNKTTVMNPVPVETHTANGIDSTEIINNISSALKTNALPDQTSDSKQEGGHRPWMLMSYKNKKMNSTKLPGNAVPVKSGSRFTLLQNFFEGFDDALREEPPTPIQELGKNQYASEPKIVTQWKKVPAKAKGKSETSSSGRILAEFNPRATPNSLKPLKDITNGKLDWPKVAKSSSNVSKHNTRTHSISQSRKKHSEAHDIIAKAPFPNLESLISGVQSQPVPSDTSILFGHCPPEILDTGSDCPNAMDVILPVPPHNDQVCSDLVSKTIDVDLSHENIDTGFDISSNLEDMSDD
ncbi:hypothetical protein M0R45_000758 [Rubus argutus]|uniref:Uncharacterized protein n=1 Tax=Rubus argutus TaxID=59490 RepID=A0AAW1VPU7_RUBAR